MMPIGSTTTLFNGPRSQPLASGATLIYEAILVDENSNPIAAADLTSLSLSIINPKTGAVINTVDDEDILNTDRGSVDSNGKLVIVLLPEDTECQGVEDRALVLTWVYGIDERVGRHQIIFKVTDLLGD